MNNNDIVLSSIYVSLATVTGFLCFAFKKRKGRGPSRPSSAQSALELKDMTSEQFFKFLLKFGKEIKASPTPEGLTKTKLPDSVLKNIKSKDIDVESAEWAISYLATIVCKKKLNPSYLCSLLLPTEQTKTRIITALEGKLVGFLTYNVDTITDSVNTQTELEIMKHADSSLTKKDSLFSVGTMCSAKAGIGKKLMGKANEIAIQRNCKLLTVNHPVPVQKDFITRWFSKIIKK